MKRLLVISRDADALNSISQAFPSVDIGHDPDLDHATAREPDSRTAGVVLDLRLVEDARERTFDALRRAFPAAQLIALAPADRMRDLVAAVKAGASDYLTYPLREEELVHVRECIDRTALAPELPDHLAGDFWSEDALEIVGATSEAMGKVFRKIRQVAETRSTVLLTGETGTGKSLMARLIHAHSSRRDQPFAAVHCGAIPDTLVESELFGHERGAFTGAERRKIGRFEAADGGTIFLDEVGTIGIPVQVKLLDVLQERTFHRVGGENAIQVDVRIIAATNLDLAEASEQGEFRKDLYYRLNVFPIALPPLRERRGDIPVIVESFLKKFAELHEKDVKTVDTSVMDALEKYDWPGNVRELQSVIERAFIMESTTVLTPDSFEELMPRPVPVQPVTLPPESTLPAPQQESSHADPAEPLAVVRKRAADAAEEAYLRDKLSAHAGRIADTARSSGITVRQLHKLMVKHGLRKEDFKKKG
jgi:DNA-binding NtrC family response regulator